MALNKEQISERFKALQDYICRYLEQVDGKAQFVSDNWTREAGGGGRTNTLTEGAVIEKGGVAFSAVYGPVSEQMRNALLVDGSEFYATGVSIVIHPGSPHVPIIHMNVRYFEYDNGKKYWFGGGIDLTPHYVIPEQATAFHTALKTICDKYNSNFYPRFKNWADDYFFQPHRDETRGIGGIFYDHLDETSGLDKQQLLDFAIDLGEAFPRLYEYQVNLGKEKAILPEHIEWRNIRRGRYVEFNLLHDRGTKFGLHSGGRTESILMSLPKDASWEYMKPIPAGSIEEQTQSLLKKGVDWIHLTDH